MSKFNQIAPRTIYKAKQIVDSLVKGERELGSFPDLYQKNSLTHDVLDELIFRIRPLTLMLRQLECKLDKFTCEHNDRAIAMTEVVKDKGQFDD